MSVVNIIVIVCFSPGATLLGETDSIDLVGIVTYENALGLEDIDTPK